MKDNLSRMLALFVASCIFVRMSVLCVFAWTGILYYVMIMCFAFYSLYIYTKGVAVYSIDKPLLCFLAVGFISIVFNDVDYHFQPWLRLLGFVIISISFGPLLESKQNLLIKKKIFIYFKNLGIIFCITSLFLKFPGVSFFAPLAFGLGYHDMVVAPIAYIVSIFVLNDLLMFRKRRLITLMALMFCLGCGMLTGSRGALGSFLLAISLYIILVINGPKKILYIFLCLSFAYFMYEYNPFGLLDHFFEKMERDSSDMSFVLSGRDQMIEDRLKDFQESPLYGAGFASMKNILNSKVDFQSRIIESGSSWFLLLGSTGLLGVLFFILTVIMDIGKAFVTKTNIPALVAIVFILSHMTVEGYIISFGAPMCAIFWMFLSLIKGNVEFCNIINSK